MSVGHVARAFEDANIATVIIAVKSFETRMKIMSLPRVLLTPQLLGRPLGNPFDEQEHTKILSTAIKMLETAEQNGTIQDFH